MEERLKEILRKFNLSSAQLADRIGVQRSSVSHILSGRNKPGFDFIQKLLKSFPEINAEWLITGTGSLNKPGSPGIAGAELFDPQINKETEPPARNTADDTTPHPKPEKKEVERVIVFYSDQSFREYIPDK